MVLPVNDKIQEIYENLNKIDLIKTAPNEKIFRKNLTHGPAYNQEQLLELAISTTHRVLRSCDEHINIDNKIISIKEYKENILKNINKDYNFNISVLDNCSLILNYHKNFEKNLDKTEFYFFQKKNTFPKLDIEHTLEKNKHILPLSIANSYHQYLKNGGILDLEYKMKMEKDKKYYYIIKNDILFIFNYQEKHNNCKIVLKKICNI